MPRSTGSGGRAAGCVACWRGRRWPSSWHWSLGQWPWCSGSGQPTPARRPSCSGWRRSRRRCARPSATSPRCWRSRPTGERPRPRVDRRCSRPCRARPASSVRRGSPSPARPRSAPFYRAVGRWWPCSTTIAWPRVRSGHACRRPGMGEVRRWRCRRRRQLGDAHPVRRREAAPRPALTRPRTRRCRPLRHDDPSAGDGSDPPRRCGSGRRRSPRRPDPRRRRRTRGRGDPVLGAGRT